MESILRISEAANLAIHAMVYLLRLEESKTVAVAEIAGDLSVSKDHLGKVLQRLNKVGLVHSKRGPKGGFSLGTRASSITLLQILEAVEGPIGRAACLLGRRICGEGGCILGDLVGSVNHQVHEYLSGTTLGDMRERADLAKPKKARKARKKTKRST
jgi:Rrf2 family protein